MMRKRLSALILLLLTVALSSTTVSVAAAEAPVTVTAWFYSGSPAVSEWAKEFNARFNANNPDIKLEFQLMAYDQINTGLIVAAASGVGPDIAYFPANLIPGRIAQGLTTPLNRYLDAWPDSKDFIPDLLKAVTDADGRVHALPFAMWGIFDLYNTDMFLASALTMPHDWDSLLQTARKLTTYNSDGSVRTYGYACSHTLTLAIYNLELAMQQLGKGMISIGDTSVDLNNERATTALNFLQELWQTGMPDGNSGASDLSFSVNGRTAIQGYATYNLLDIAPSNTTSLEPRRVVGPNAGQDLIRFNAGMLYILSTSKHPDAAWRVLADFTSPDNSAGYLQAQVSYLPVRRSVLAKMSTIVTHPLALKMAQLMYSPMTTYGAVHEYWAAIHPVGAPLILSVLQGKRAIPGTLEEAERLMNAALAEQLSRAK
ncbi:MAG TPA: extracellular solute-binding protein [Firmicutes bacterium]|nr:extracellular solute-binding protein [Bacillota bacterium]